MQEITIIEESNLLTNGKALRIPAVGGELKYASSEGIGYLDTISIGKPEARGKGLAEWMMYNMAATFQSERIEKIRLSSPAIETGRAYPGRAGNFYLRMGFNFNLVHAENPSPEELERIAEIGSSAGFKNTQDLLNRNFTDFLGFWEAPTETVGEEAAKGLQKFADNWRIG